MYNPRLNSSVADDGKEVMSELSPGGAASVTSVASPIKPEVFVRYQRAERLLPLDRCRLLDYGCGVGDFLGWIKTRRPNLECHGADVSRKAIEEARQRSLDVQFHVLNPNAPMFHDGYFDAVSMLDVLEHVPNETQTLTEVARLLSPGGVLVLSVPHAGPFAWMDTGNIKFRFPRFHKAFYRYILRDMEVYRNKFGSTEDGLYGDISYREEMWHKHYRFEEIEGFLGTNFDVKETQYFSLLQPVWTSMTYVWRLLLHRSNRLLDSLVFWDAGFEKGRFSYNLIVKGVKK